MAKQAINFSIFAAIGAALLLLQTFLLWMLIDVMKYPTLLTTSVITVALYIGKYYTYILVGLMKNKFLKYNIINLSTMALSILSIWVLVDFAGWYASLSTIMVAIILVIIRFTIFNHAGMIKDIGSG